MNKFFVNRAILNPQAPTHKWVPGWHGWFTTTDGSTTFEITITTKINGVYLVSLKNHDVDLGLHPRSKINDVPSEVTSWFTNTKDINEWLTNVLLIDITIVDEENNDF